MVDNRTRRITKLLLSQAILYGAAVIEYSIVKAILKPKTINQKLTIFTGCIVLSDVVIASSYKRIYDVVDKAADSME